MTAKWYPHFTHPKPQMGLLIGRPYFTLIDKEKCLKILPKLLKKDSMDEWLKDKQEYENDLTNEKENEQGEN